VVVGAAVDGGAVVDGGGGGECGAAVALHEPRPTAPTTDTMMTAAARPTRTA
jgi:hypothetical protein